MYALGDTEERAWLFHPRIGAAKRTRLKPVAAGD
jgi:hypothetical protein